jgi:hypothetical protein
VSRPYVRPAWYQFLTIAGRGGAGARALRYRRPVHRRPVRCGHRRVGGWGGAACGIVGALGAATLSRLIVGDHGLDKRVVRRVIEAADPELAQLPERSGDQIAKYTAEFFAEAGRQVTAEVRGHIDEQVLLDLQRERSQQAPKAAVIRLPPGMAEPAAGIVLPGRGCLPPSVARQAAWLPGGRALPGGPWPGGPWPGGP